MFPPPEPVADEAPATPEDQPTAAPPDPAALPRRGQRRDEDHWARVDRGGVRLARAALLADVASTVVMTTGLVMLANDARGDRGLQVAGPALTTLGTVGILASAPLYLVGFGRSERGMRERGVRVGDGLLPVSWTLYGSAAPLAPLFVLVPPTLPVWSIGVMGLGAGVGTHQARVRDEADLPDPGTPWRPAPGVAVTGTF